MRLDNGEKKPPMQNVTLNIPDIYERDLKILKDKGLISSKSEGVREAIREFLQEQIENLETLRYGEVSRV